MRCVRRGEVRSQYLTSVSRRSWGSVLRRAARCEIREAEVECALFGAPVHLEDLSVTTRTPAPRGTAPRRRSPPDITDPPQGGPRFSMARRIESSRTTTSRADVAADPTATALTPDPGGQIASGETGPVRKGCFRSAVGNVAPVRQPAHGGRDAHDRPSAAREHEGGSRSRQRVRGGDVENGWRVRGCPATSREMPSASTHRHCSLRCRGARTDRRRSVRDARPRPSPTSPPLRLPQSARGRGSARPRRRDRTTSGRR